MLRQFLLALSVVIGARALELMWDPATAEDSTLCQKGLTEISLDNIAILGAPAKYGYISDDGYIGINDRFSLGGYEYELNQPPYIAPFLAVLSGYDTLHAYYDDAVVYGKIPEDMLPSLSTYIESAKADSVYTPGKRKFEAKLGTRVLWKNMHKYIKSPSEADAVNTFGVYLVSDRRRTYALFHYENLGDVSPVGQDGKVFAKAGVNMGWHRGFYKLPFSGTEDVGQLQTFKTVTGNYPIIDLGTENVDNMGCWKYEWQPSNFTVTMSDMKTNYQGGKYIEAKGPFLESDVGSAELYFNDVLIESKPGTPPTDPSQKQCSRVFRVPSPIYPGRNTFKIVTPLHTYEMELAGDAIQAPGRGIELDGDWDSYLEPEDLSARWELPEDQPNWTTNLDIVLYDSEKTTLATNEADIIPIARNLLGNVWYMEKGKLPKCQHEKCLGVKTGLLRATIFDDKKVEAIVEWSKPISMAWYIRDWANANHGVDWPMLRCKQWDAQEQDQTWMGDNLGVCPCSLQQALSDFVHFIPDPSCYPGNRDKDNCKFHTQGESCFLTANPEVAEGLRCCYAKAGELIEVDSSPDKASIMGTMPGATPKAIPQVTHFDWDHVPQLDCCQTNESNFLRASGGNCSIYLDKRPARTCSPKPDGTGGYEKIKFATAFGDPHFVSFSGHNMTLPVVGDLVLLKKQGSFMIYGRMSAIESKKPNKQYEHASEMVAVVMLSGPVRIEIRRRLPHQMALGHVDILVGGKIIQMARYGFTYMAGDFMINDNSKRPGGATNITISYSAMGMGFRVTHVAGGLQVIIGVIESMVPSLEGFLTFDFNYGSPFVSNTAKEKLVQYGRKWYFTNVTMDNFFADVMPERTRRSLDYEGYVFIQPPYDAEAALAICEESWPCTHDYAMLYGDEEVALATKTADEDMQALTYMSYITLACPAIQVEGVLFQGSNNKGGKLVATGCQKEGYKLVGTLEYICDRQANGFGWNNVINVKCESEGDRGSRAGGERMNFGIVIVLILLVMVVIILVVIGVCIMRKRMATQSGGYKVKHPGDAEAQPMTPKHEANNH